ncbi:MAG: heavy metal translocating P-type ATPase [Clostridia bacterium]|nr:heavy metal translocating P-type ATPase [Clostridia bacterium]
MKQRFSVTGMTCSACSSHVHGAVSRLAGVEDTQVNLMTNSMTVSYDPARVTDAQIMDAVKAAGYGAAPMGAAPKSANTKQPSDTLSAMKRRLLISFAFLIPLMYLSMGHMVGLPLPAFLSGHPNAVAFALTQLLLCLPIVYVNRAYYEKGVPSLFRRAPNMDTLVAVGSTAALVYGVFALYRMAHGIAVGDTELVVRYHEDLYFESAAMILTLITLGKFLETRSKNKTTQALQALMDLAPKTAVVERDGSEITIPLEHVSAGDIVIVRSGGRIPVDGVVIEGRAAVDESAITGESVPVEKDVGSQAISATVNQSGYLKFRATRVGEDTTLAQIIRLVEDAGAGKAPIAKTADKIAAVFVPVVMLIALVTAIVWLFFGNAEEALSSAICVLVISCPCALGLATPVAVMVGTEQGAKNGILIKSGEALEIAHHVNCVVLDKTGTITNGKPVVTDVLPLSVSENELLRVAAALENRSEHPLSAAIMAEVSARGIEVPPVTAFETLPGRGVSAELEGTPCYAGNERLMRENEVDTAAVRETLDSLADAGKTPLIVAENGKVIGVIAAADLPKETSREAISKLKRLGISVRMLTGDNRRTAEAVAADVGVDEVIAEVLPQDKEAVIARIRDAGQTVTMVGDGINDAPALVRADVGMAIGAGTDVAVESADIVLMKNDLRDVVTAIRLSRAVIRNIRQNLFWAFFYNCLGIPLAAGVFYPLLGWRLSPMIGAAAMSLSSVFVVTNALRLRRFRSKPTLKKERTTMVRLTIEGMMCQHCRKRVEDTLNALPGVHATVDLDKKQAIIDAGTTSAEVLAKAVTDAGYTVTAIDTQ